MVSHHNLPPGVQGDTRGHLSLAVDEVVWLHGSGGASVLAEWWGSKQEEQVLFSPVDVRNFSSGSGGKRPVLQHSYPVNTSKEKLEQYLKDASPLPLSLLDRQGQSVGRAAVALSLEEIEGYFPVWSSSQGREIANLHVKLSYREADEDAQDIPVQLGKSQNKRGKLLKRVTKDGSSGKGRAGVLSSEEGRKTQRVTFSEGEIGSRPLSSSNFSPLSGIASINTPIADSLITDLLNQSATLRANMREQLAETELVLEEDEKENLPPTSNLLPTQLSASPCPLPSSLPPAPASTSTTPAPPIPWNLSVSRLKQLACVRTLTTTVLSITLDSSLLARLRRPQNQKRGFVAGRLAKSSTSAVSRQQSLAFFVRFGLPGGKEASFCSRKVSQGGRAEFGESDVSQVTCSPTLLDQWWTSSLDFSLYCRFLGQRSPLLLGTASIGLKHLLDSEAMLSAGLSLALPVYAAQGLARSLGVARAETREIVANISVTLKFGIGEVVKEKKVRPLSPRKAEREGDDTSPTPQNLPTEEERNIIRPQTVTLHSVSAPLQISQPVLALLKADPAPSLPQNCTLVHRTWGGEEVRGANLSCTEVLLVPGHAARTANKQLISRLLANYLVVEVWQGQQLIGLARLPTAPLHSGLSNGEPDHVVEAMQGLVQVIGIKNGESVGQLMVGLWAGTLKQLDMLGGAEGRSDKKNPNTERVDRETMTELVEQFADSIMVNESATEEGMTHEYDTPASETELFDVSKDEDTVREVLQSSSEGRLESPVADVAGCLLLQISVIEGHNLPPNTSLYCTVLGVTSSVARNDDNRTYWDFVADLNMGLDYLTDPRKRLIIKVWNLKGTSPDAEHDQMVGFAAIDISPLQALPCLSGWYNILDWVGKCRGQISLKVKPLKPVPRFGEQDRQSSGGDPRQMKYVVQGTYSTFPSHLVSHTRQIISPVMAMAPPKNAPQSIAQPSEKSVHPQFNFLPDDPTRSFLEGRLASNLADLEHLSKNLAASLQKGEAQVEQAVQADRELEEPSLNDTTFLIVGRPEEEMATGRSIASFSMMQSTIDDNLACIKGLAGRECSREELAGGGEGCSLAEQRIQEPIPTSLPDLNLVLQDLGLDLDTLQPQVFTDRSRVGPEGGNPEI